MSLLYHKDKVGMQNKLMSKERLVAFTDAVLAIIMTILVLELREPSSATLGAIWDLRESYFAYALSFFWLGTMWINLHNEWHGIDQVSSAVLWWSLILLFFSSLIPYSIRFVNIDYYSSVAQGFYGIIVICVTLANLFLNLCLEKANPSESRKDNFFESRKKLYIDLAFKFIGLFVTLFIYPPAMMIAVLITMIYMIIPGRSE